MGRKTVTKNDSAISISSDALPSLPLPLPIVTGTSDDAGVVDSSSSSSPSSDTQVVHQSLNLKRVFLLSKSYV